MVNIIVDTSNLLTLYFKVIVYLALVLGFSITLYKTKNVGTLVELMKFRNG